MPEEMHGEPDLAGAEHPESEVPRARTPERAALLVELGHGAVELGRRADQREPIAAARDPLEDARQRFEHPGSLGQKEAQQQQAERANADRNTQHHIVGAPVQQQQREPQQCERNLRQNRRGEIDDHRRPGHGPRYRRVAQLLCAYEFAAHRSHWQ